MRAGQLSFSSGEISPILHARSDLAKYFTSLAELKNMIVLPQGGVTRRSGIKSFANTSNRAKLIPFEYNSTDSCLLEFRYETINVWVDLSKNPHIAATLQSPYTLAEVNDIRYIQSGNVLFLAHGSYAPRMLTRKSLTDWEIKPLPFHGGPFIDGAEWNLDAILTLTSVASGDNVREIKSNVPFFNTELIGTLLKLEYAIPPRREEIDLDNETASSQRYEVKGTFNVSTSGAWLGELIIERSADGGVTWIAIRQYKRTDVGTQGQWDFSVAENDPSVLYRVKWIKYHHPEKEDPTGGLASVLASGFLKSEIYKIYGVENSSTAYIMLQKDLGFSIPDNYSGRVSLWSIGCWGNFQGFPRSIAMYQDRLVFAGTSYQPQTIWFSKTGDYSNFSISDPLKDDDAVSVTLAGSKADGIHSLLASSVLMAFTHEGEWKISGSGDSGAITPSSLTAHQFTSIGSKKIQPVSIDGRVVFVQAQGRKVFTIGYDLNVDNYVGNELSILSEELFKKAVITDMAYQEIPDNLIWFVLSNGDFVSCTYTPEHEVIGWAKHNSHYDLLQIAAIAGEEQTEIICIADTDESQLLMKFLPRKDQIFQDNAHDYESLIRTLRLSLNTENGSIFTNKKFIPRVIVSAINSSEAWAAPGELNDENRNWQRRRKIKWENVNYLTDADIQLDNGFSEYACIQIRSIGSEPLTILAITPILKTGGD